MLIDTATTLGACALIAVGAFVVHSQLRRGKGQAPVPPSPVVAALNQLTLQQRPKAQMPILQAPQLLANTGTVGELEKIRTRLGLSPVNFERDVLVLIHNLAEYVQYLPASESHHHAHPGGLLQHTLEVAAHALALRQGYKLPLGASPEDQIRLSAVWSYGVLVAALLHDIGKPVADVVVQLYGQNIHAPLRQWSGLAGSMVDAAQNSTTLPFTHYTVAFPVERDYQAHQRLPLMLLHALVPSSSLQWLASDPALMQELMLYLEGTQALDRPSAIRDIVTRADSLSVAGNLATGSRIRFTSARSVPLIERLMKGLRALLSEGMLALNRPGAAGFVDPDGEHMWMVAGVAADQTRKLLEQREDKATGAAGLPADNTRFFDTWAEYGALVQPDKAFGKGSVWWVRIEIEDWSQILTVLKFPLHRLYADGQPRPDALPPGSVTPVDPKTQRKNAAVNADEVSSPTVSGDAAAVYSPDSPETNEATEATEANEATEATAPDVPAQEIAATEQPAVCTEIDSNEPPSDLTPEEFLEESDTATRGTRISAPGRAVQVMPRHPRQEAPPKAMYRSPGAMVRENADAFMAWVQIGLGTGDLNFNESDAVIHFVDEGMLLVTPRAFKLYLETNKFVGSIGASKDELRALQNEMQKSGYIAKQEGGSSFVFWQVRQGDGEPGAVITTYLIPNPQAYIRPVPAPNELLQRCEAPPRKTTPLKPANRPSP